MNDDLYAVIKKTRTEQGLSVPQLAKTTGLHYNTLYDIENGRRDPSISRLSKIYKALGLTLVAGFVSDEAPSGMHCASCDGHSCCDL